MDISNGNASRMFLSKNTGEGGGRVGNESPPEYITTYSRQGLVGGVTKPAWCQLQSRDSGGDRDIDYIQTIDL